MAERPKKPGIFTLEPIFWAGLFYLIGFLIIYFYLPKEKVYIDEVIGGELPTYSLLPVLGYFFGAVIVIGLFLFFIPVSRLKLVLRFLFGFFYGWGIFIITFILLPLPWQFALAIGITIALIWLLWPIIWLQNLLLIMTLVSVAAVFGALIPAWTLIWVLIAISIYDVVAVALGYMMWLAKKLSQADTLPAFIFPKKLSDWNTNLKGSTVSKLFDEEAAEREYSLLGGGDIGFPLLLVVAVFFGYGLFSAFVVAGTSFAGLIFAYLIQIYILKGKPLPALPPISLLAIIGFLIVYFV